MPILGHVNGPDERDDVVLYYRCHMAIWPTPLARARSFASLVCPVPARDGTHFSALRGGAYDNVQTVR